MIPQLAQLITRAVEETLEDRVAVAFSGGLDSTVIAAVARKHAQVELFTAGVEGSEDIAYAGKAAAELGLPLRTVVMDERKLMETYARCHALLPLGLHKLEILVPLHSAASAAAEAGHRTMLLGSGAEELFVGYERYYGYLAEGKDLDSVLREEFRTLPQRDIGWARKICRSFGMDARFPFHNKKLAELMFSVPLEERMHDRELKKGVLREAGKMLGVPELVLRRRKKAMQYGSGVHKLLIRHAEDINRSYPSATPLPPRC